MTASARHGETSVREAANAAGERSEVEGSCHEFRSRQAALRLLASLVVTLGSATVFAQSGPGFSFDPDDQSASADGIDAISPYNGQLALTIPIGPAYQVGPGLSFQAKLHYSSRVWGPGTWALWPDPPNPLLIPEPYMLLQGDPALGLGWSFSLGKIVEAAAGVPAGYIAPDGSAHRLYNKRFFGGSSDGYYYTRDGSYLRVQYMNSTDGYNMWAPNGNRTKLSHKVTGCDDPANNYINDYGRGRNGWHAKEIANTYNNYNDKITITYQTTAACNGSNYPWVPDQITIPAIGGGNRTVDVGMQSGLIRTITVSTFNGGNSTYTLYHSTHSGGGLLRPIDHPSTNPNPKYLDRIELPLSGYDYNFTYHDDFSPPNMTAYARGALESQQTPLDAKVNYEYGTWTFYHANILNRPSTTACAFPPPPFSGRPIYVTGPGEEPDNLLPISDCTAPDRAAGVVKRTVDFNGATTEYHQYSFPNGETNSAIGAQAETLVLSPTNVAGGRHSTTYLFTASTASGSSGDITGPLVGSLIRVATFADDASSGYTGQGAVCSYSNFCATQALRIERLSYETDGFDSTPGSIDGLEANRRLSQRVTIYKGLADGSPPSGKYHTVDYDFDANAGQYSKETHSGTIGGDARELTTTWAPDTSLWKLDKAQTANLRATAGGSNFSSVASTFDAAGYTTAVTITDGGGFGSLQLSTPRDSHGFPQSESFAHGGVTRTRDLTFQYGTLKTAKWSGFSWFALNNSAIDQNTGLVATYSDSASQNTTFTYDALSRPLVTTPPGGDALTTTTYESATSALTKVEGGGTEFGYSRTTTDKLGRPTKVQRKVASTLVKKTFAYDDQGNTTFESEWVLDSEGSPKGTSFSNFDHFGRPRTITRADGTTTSLDYSDTGTYPNSTWKTAVTIGNVGGNSSTTKYQSDTFGNVVTVSEPSPVSSDTTYTYNPQNALTKVTQGSQTREFTFDAFGFLRTEKYPERTNQTISYGPYDPLGNVLTESQPGATITRSYDGAGRLLTVKVGSTDYLANCYDGAGACNGTGGSYPQGKLTRQTGYNPSASPNVSFQQDYTYSNAAGRLSARTTTVSTGALGTVSEAWRYDRTGNVVQYNLPRTSGLFAVETAYDHGLPVAVRGNGLPVVSGVTYHPAGHLATYSTGNGTGPIVTTTLEADPNSMARPRRIYTAGASTNLDTGLYSYDGAGNVTAMGGDSFAYDRLSRLTGVDYVNQATTCPSDGSKNQCYSYDKWGNLLDVTGTFPRSYCSGSCTNNRVTATGTTYDTRGNLTTVTLFGTENYAYDHLDRAWRYHSAPSFDWTYEYDGTGERIVRFPTGGATSTYIWALRDEHGRLASEYVGTAFGRANVYLGSLLVASYATCSLNGVPGWTYYSSDHLGSPRVVTDANAITLDSRKYWPYGDDASGLITSTQRTQFAAMERDTEGIGNRYYDHARSYDPKGLGRFLSVDLLGGSASEPQSWNRYRYANGSPATFTDPLGLAAVDIGSTVSVGGRDFHFTVAAGDPSDFGQVFSGVPAGEDLHAAGIFWEFDEVPAGDVRVVSEWELPEEYRQELLFNAIANGASLAAPVANALGKGLLGFFTVVAPSGLLGSYTGLVGALRVPAYTLYRSVNTLGEVQYVGITTNFIRRAAEHAGRFEIERIATGLSYAEARGAEQVLINAHGFARTGGTLLNRINSIARSNPAYRHLIERGTEALRARGLPFGN